MTPNRKIGDGIPDLPGVSDLQTVKDLMEWAARNHAGPYLLASESSFDFAATYERCRALAIDLRKERNSANGASRAQESPNKAAGIGHANRGSKSGLFPDRQEEPIQGFALYLDNGLEFAFYSLACMLGGIPFLALHPDSSPTEVQKALGLIPFRLITDEIRKRALEPVWPVLGQTCIIADLKTPGAATTDPAKEQLSSPASPAPESTALSVLRSHGESPALHLSHGDVLQSALRLHRGLDLHKEHRLGCLDSMASPSWLVATLLLPLIGGSSLRLFPVVSPYDGGRAAKLRSGEHSGAGGLREGDLMDVNFVLGSARSFQNAMKDHGTARARGGLAGGDFLSRKEMQELLRTGLDLRLGYSLKPCAGFVALSKPASAAPASGPPRTTSAHPSGARDQTGWDWALPFLPLSGVELRIASVDSESARSSVQTSGRQSSIAGQIMITLSDPRGAAEQGRPEGDAQGGELMRGEAAGENRAGDAQGAESIRRGAQGSPFEGSAGKEPLATGDAGILQNGELFLSGRLSESIRRMDHVVFPAEVEWALRLHPHIQEAAVSGISDAEMGEQVVAFVVPEPQQTLEDRQIMDFLRSMLPAEKLPGKILRIRRIPRDRQGRPQRRILLEDYARKQKVLNKVPGVIDIDYHWVYGKALSRFYAGLMNEEKIYGTRCPSCDRIQVPPKIYCGVCFVECTEYVQVPRTGVLESFTTVYLEYPGQPKKPPYTYGYVKLDGTHTHLYHLVENAELDQIFAGMRVEAVFKAAADRTGTLYDIKYFQPVP
ncbi:MAG: OB-fold domain-containing protein [Leptospiraceae bacterium]|nr:OB-fold domain-containing protein [Leptospiraceae bacterium]